LSISEPVKNGTFATILLINLAPRIELVISKKDVPPYSRTLNDQPAMLPHIASPEA